MSVKIKYWCDSGANAFSTRTGFVTLDELGVNEDEWRSMSEEEKEKLMYEVACDRLDWGFAEV